MLLNERWDKNKYFCFIKAVESNQIDRDGNNNETKFTFEMDENNKKCIEGVGLPVKMERKRWVNR